MYHYQAPPRSKLAIAGWIFMALLLLWQLAPYAVEGDRRLTLEENRIGMFMFEANHECRNDGRHRIAACGDQDGENGALPT